MCHASTCAMVQRHLWQVCHDLDPSSQKESHQVSTKTNSAPAVMMHAPKVTFQNKCQSWSSGTIQVKTVGEENRCEGSHQLLAVFWLVHHCLVDQSLHLFLSESISLCVLGFWTFTEVNQKVAHPTPLVQVSAKSKEWESCQELLAWRCLMRMILLPLFSWDCGRVLCQSHVVLRQNDFVMEMCQSAHQNSMNHCEISFKITRKFFILSDRLSQIHMQ